MNAYGVVTVIARPLLTLKTYKEMIVNHMGFYADGDSNGLCYDMEMDKVSKVR